MTSYCSVIFRLVSLLTKDVGRNTCVYISRHPALFSPESYGKSGEQAVYSMEGIYTFSDSGDQQNARLYFVNGVLQEVYSFSGENTAGSPRQIIPQTGDTFTILDTWMDLDSQGNVTQTVHQAGETLTFSERMFTWEVMDAATGQYVVGFIIEDVDGILRWLLRP